MKCPNCESEMERDENIVITYFGIVGHPQKHKTGWECPECECIKFDNGERI